MPTATLADVDERDWDPRWLEIGQCGVISRAQALSRGMTGDGIRHRIRSGGAWQRLLPGVYLTNTGVPTRAQFEVAASLFAGPDSVITGPAALRNLGLAAPETDAVDVLVPASRQRASRDFAVIHRTYRMPEARLPDFGRCYVYPPRAVADTARSLTKLADVRALVAEAVQREQCTIGQLGRELAEGSVRGSALLRSVLAEVADGIRSAPEGDLRDLITRGGLPVPRYNVDLYLGDEFLARPDAWWPQFGVVVEVDSRRWHLSPDQWEATMRRHNRLIAAGFAVLHFSPHQLRTEPDLVIAKISAALRVGRTVAGVSSRPAAA